MKLIDLTGKIFTRWTVLEKSASNTATGQPRWLCRCECGVEKIVTGANLRGGKSSSCGCLRDDMRVMVGSLRDFSGRNNPKAKAAIAKYGDSYVPSSSIWYKRASGVFFTAKAEGIPCGFSSVSELAAYVKSIAPSDCPVFGLKFEDAPQGFSNWSPSIDKIDPKKGYIKGNIQVISTLANCMKRDATPQQLKTFAHWVLKE